MNIKSFDSNYKVFSFDQIFLLEC